MNTDAFNKDPNDPLWDLLGKAKVAEVSPFFARNVLREIRRAQDQTQTPLESVPRGVWAVLARWRFAMASCVAACAVACVVVTATSAVLFQGHEGSLALRSGDAEVISNLDELLAYENSTVWLHKPAH